MHHAFFAAITPAFAYEERLASNPTTFGAALSLLGLFFPSQPSLYDVILLSEQLPLSDGESLQGGPLQPSFGVHRPCPARPPRG